MGYVVTTMQRLAIVDAERALKAYAPGGVTHLESIRSNITSLITDLMHLCDNHGLDFDNALEIARDMHKEDCRDPRESKRGFAFFVGNLLNQEPSQ